jgi:hypothetical protein
MDALKRILHLLWELIWPYEIDGHLNRTEETFTTRHKISTSHPRR